MEEKLRLFFDAFFKNDITLKTSYLKCNYNFSLIKHMWIYTYILSMCLTIIQKKKSLYNNM